MPIKPKILVVENDASFRRMFETGLRQIGAEARCVSNAQEAIKRVEMDKFDGVFLDWSSVGTKGEEVTRRIRASKSNAKVPIAMLVAQGDVGAVKSGFALGVTFHLAKPFGQKELQRLLNATRGTMLEERRRYMRVPMTVPVVCEWAQNNEQKRVPGRTVNVSTTGLLVALVPHPGLGIEAALEMLLPALKRNLTPKGLVKRVTPDNQVAFQFVKFPGEERELLETFLTREPPGP
jgi:CheY-like chemotaxis protein